MDNVKAVSRNYQLLLSQPTHAMDSVKAVSRDNQFLLSQPTHAMDNIKAVSCDNQFLLSQPTHAMDSQGTIIIIIMYIYHALSAHMIYINLNMIFYTHVMHSPYLNNPHKADPPPNTHTHTNHNEFKCVRH